MKSSLAGVGARRAQSIVILPPPGPASLAQPLLGSEGASSFSSAGGSSSSRDPRPKRQVADLPDLTEKIHEMGMYPQYLSFRKGYLEWRQGASRGAQGEVTAHVFENKAKAADDLFWILSPNEFKFLQTVSFWVLATFLEGSVVFALSAALGVLAEKRPEYEACTELAALGNVGGAICYSCGAYFGVFEVINMTKNKHREPRRYFTLNRKQLPEGITCVSVLGFYAYFIGAMSYQVGTAAGTFGLTPGSASEIYLVYWPYLFGGVMFTVAGFCELHVNNVFFSLPVKAGWWVAFFNASGGILFVLSSLVESMANWLTFWGANCYGAACVAGFLMWRGEQFGLGMIPGTTGVAEDEEESAGTRSPRRSSPRSPIDNGGSQKKSSTLSRRASFQEAATAQTPAASDEEDEFGFTKRGMVFVGFYACGGAVFIMNCCCFIAQGYVALQVHNAQQSLEALVGLLYNLAVVMLIHLLLLLQCAAVRVPKEQPYHCLTIMLRYVFLIILTAGILQFVVLIHSRAVQ